MDSPPPSFAGYPKAVEIKDIKYERDHPSNPVFSGVPLAVGAYIISSTSFVPKFLWGNAGFGGLRKLPYLSDYIERYDPTVIPLSTGENLVSSKVLTGAESFKDLPKETPGRYYSIADYHSLYLSRELTPLAVVKSLLPLIRRDVTPRNIHSFAFIDSDVEHILKTARESTQRYKDGSSLGLLDGIPVGVKDEVDVAGYRTTLGRKMDEKMFPIKKETIWPVQMWEKSGAIVMGKTNMHELGMDTTNINPNWGTPRNPHNDQYYTGGSSGGSAYAVSAGILPITLGKDGGGSIRLPSSFCGVYGLKPSHGRLGKTNNTLTAMGPIAASISDLEVAFRVMAQPDLANLVGSLFSQPQPLSGKRAKIIGICEPWFDQADPEVQSRCREVIDYYRKKLGYEIVSIDIPNLVEGQLAHALTFLSEAATHHKGSSTPSRHWLTDLNPANQVLMAVGEQTPAYDFQLSAQLRSLLMSHLAFLYRKHPGLVIVTPTCPMAGWPIAHEGDLKYGISDGNKSMRNMVYVWLSNFAGCPSISCPAGYVEPEKGKGTGRVPIGIMGMGEWGSEDALIEWGRDAEKWLTEEYPGGRQRPAKWENVIKNAKAEMMQ